MNKKTHNKTQFNGEQKHKLIYLQGTEIIYEENQNENPRKLLYNLQSTYNHKEQWTKKH